MSAPAPDWRQRHAAARSATKWRAASAVNGRTERTPAVRGSRASTTPAPSYRDVTPAPSGRPPIELPTAPRQPQHPASQTLPAPSGRQPSPPLAVTGRGSGAASMAEGHPEGARSVQPARAKRDPRPANFPADLPNREGASTMAKPAPRFFYACRKFVPQVEILESLPEFLKKRCNPLILRSYTLCEVNGAKGSIPAASGTRIQPSIVWIPRHKSVIAPTY